MNLWQNVSQLTYSFHIQDFTKVMSVHNNSGTLPYISRLFLRMYSRNVTETIKALNVIHFIQIPVYYIKPGVKISIKLTVKFYKKVQILSFLHSRNKYLKKIISDMFAL